MSVTVWTNTVKGSGILSILTFWRHCSAYAPCARSVNPTDRGWPLGSVLCTVFGLLLLCSAFWSRAVLVLDFAAFCTAQATLDLPLLCHIRISLLQIATKLFSGILADIALTLDHLGQHVILQNRGSISLSLFFRVLNLSFMVSSNRLWTYFTIFIPMYSSWDTWKFHLPM